MFFEITFSLCEVYKGLDPIKLLDYPAEDVFNLINSTLLHGRREKKEQTNVIKRPAGDDWF